MSDPRQPRFPRLKRWARAAGVVLVLTLVAAGGFLLAWLLGPAAEPGGPATAATRPAATRPADRGSATTQPSTRPARSSEPSPMYTCSMHPQVRLADPEAPCPICGMDLIPVPDHEVDGEAAGGEATDRPRLRVSERAAALMQVRVQPVEYRPAEVTVPFYGRVDYDARRVRDVNLKVAGWIEKLHVDFVGAPVAAGDPLLELYSPQLYAAQEEYLLAHRAARGDGAGSRADLREAARTRLELFEITGEQIAELERRGKPARTMTLHSPHGGVVIDRGAHEGMRVDPGTRLYRLADLSRVWVQLEAYERDLPWLAVGQTATLTARARPGERIEGEVAFIDPQVDARRRTAQVRVEVANPERRLKPGMFVRGEIEATTGKPVHLIPASAPLVTGRRAVVYVQVPGTGEPTYEAREVLLGPRAGDRWIVRQGLAEGERVVTHGAFKIDSELQIRGAPSMMQPGGAGPPPGHDHGGSATTRPAQTQPATEEDLAGDSLNTTTRVSRLPGDPVVRLAIEWSEHTGNPPLADCCIPDDRRRGSDSRFQKPKTGQPANRTTGQPVSFRPSIANPRCRVNSPWQKSSGFNERPGHDLPKLAEAREGP